MLGTKSRSHRRYAFGRIRAALSAAVFLLYAAAFAFSGPIAAGLAGLLPKLQFFPALLRALAELGAGALGTAAAIAIVALLLTAFFGRVYCACLCPLGALQDGIIRMGKTVKSVLRRHGRSGRPRSGARGFRPAVSYFHAGAFVLAAGAALAGSTILLGLLEPFSAFGKIGAGLLRPLVDMANNGLAALSRSTGSYAVANVTVSWAWARAIVGAAALVLVGAMALRSGRLYCNSLCPAGALLRVASFRSLFGLRIEAGECGNCGACERVCRASCVRPGGAGIEEDRCVRCFDCVAACPSGAIRFGRVRPASEKAETEPGLSRRRFLSSGAAAAIGVAGAGLLGGASSYRKPAVFMNGQERPPAAPPGAGSVQRFLRACTACGSCVAACPSGVLRPAEFQWGILDPAKPYLAYDRAYCQFECDRCLRSCPTGALRQLSLEEKKLTRLGQSALALDRCIVVTNKTRCGSCAEHCPTGAVSMSVPAGGGLPQPVTDSTLCIGCGACETACPVEGKKAIHVEGLKVQDRARFLQLRPGDRKKVQGSTRAPAEGKNGFPF
ncbi:MAG: 4Fe-4S dicluster domain-containing protein [Rectinemataceae bacterium]|jgi:ferredoxin